MIQDSIVEQYRANPLSEIVKASLKKDVLEALEYAGDDSAKSCEKALMNNIYFADKNSIDTLEELSSRIKNSYMLVYASALDKNMVGRKEVARQLDDMARVSLTMTGILYCLFCNTFDKLGLFIADDGVEIVTGKDGGYKGCLIYTRSGFIINTRTGLITSPQGLIAKIPEEFIPEFNVCIGCPAFFGESEPEPEQVIKGDDIDGDYYYAGDNGCYDINDNDCYVSADEGRRAL